MTDPRTTQLAQNLVRHSCRIQPGEHVLLELIDAPDEIGIALIRAVRAAGGIPHVNLRHSLITRELFAGATDEQYASIAGFELAEMQAMQAYIAIRGSANSFENASVPAEAMKLTQKHMRAVHNHRVCHTKWCVLRWPTPSMAQGAGMSTEDFEDFYFRCCLADYDKLRVAMDKLAARMMRTDRVRITGPGTDLSFSIKGLPAIPCAGELNIPDGEVFTAPVRDSVNGTIFYTAPTLFQGIPFDGVRFTFKDGKIIEAHCNGNEEALNKILDSDEGARYIGEFALGVNPEVLQPMRDILFDEKIAGSFHFTPGNAYENCDNGNRSQVHWDLVCIQRADYGGGEIYFDDELIRKDGIFTDPELSILNPATH
ncbi:MAG: aminopeptidase [Akkermansiaceae bacterium]|nr:aminopeptidase [Akkermansiaceae bacterium]